MSTHLRTHSYKYVQYQCEKCDFCGGDFYTMQVHIGNHHDDKCEFGPCEYVRLTCNFCKTKRLQKITFQTKFPKIFIL